MPRYSKLGAYAYISTPANTTCTNAGEYYLLQGIFTNEILKGFSIDAFILTYNGQKQCFEIKVNASFITDTANTEISMALFVNDVLQSNSIMVVEIDKTTDKQMISLVDVLELEAGDEVSIRVASDKAGAIIQAITGNTSAQKYQ